MTNLSNLLEHLNEDIDEAAKSVREAISEKLAAYTSNNSIILYNPQTALANIQSNINHGELVGNIINFNNAIVGYVMFDKDGSCDSYEVKQSAALQGYGPLLYDLVLSHIYPNFLVSDRTSISDKARNIWNFYLNKRPDVNKVLLASIYDKNEHCNLPQEVWNKHISIHPIISAVDDFQTQLEDAIDFQDSPESIAKLKDQLHKATIKANAALAKIPEAYKYQIRSPRGLTTLKNNHTRFINTVNSIIPKSKLYKGFNIANTIYDSLGVYAEEFFNDMYY